MLREQYIWLWIRKLGSGEERLVCTKMVVSCLELSNKWLGMLLGLLF